MSPDNDRTSSELQKEIESLRARIEELESSSLAGTKHTTTKSETVIADSERKFRAVFNQTVQFIGLTTLDGKLIEANRPALEFIGLDESQVLGKPFWDTPWWTHSAALQQRLKHAIQEAADGEQVTFEATHENEKGETFCLVFSLKPVEDENGNIIMLLAEGRDITERTRVERERMAHLYFLECMDAVDKSIRGVTDVEQAMNNMLEEVLNIFACDRAWLLFPCDPDAEVWHVPMERTRPEYPGASTLGIEVRVCPKMAMSARVLLDTDGPVRFDRESVHRLAKSLPPEHAILAQLCMAIHPTIGPPWQFGIHQCSYERVWTDEEVKLFREIGRRITDCLSSLLSLKELRESEGKFRLLAENARDMIFRIDIPERRYEYVSPASKELIGYTPEEVMALENPIETTVHPDYWQHVIDHWNNIAAGGPTPVHEFKVIRKNGEERWIFQRDVVIRDDQGRPIALEGIATDITERKRSEEENSRLRNLLRNIVNSMPSILVGVDRDGMITQWNRQAECVTGITADDAEGKAFEELIPSLRMGMDMVRQAISTKQVQQRTKVQSITDNRHQLSDVTVYPLVSNGVEGAVIRIDDITDRVRIEEMMVQTEKMISVGGLAAGMAHEINNPLGGIMLGAQNIIRRISPELPANLKAATECGTTLEAIREYMEKREILDFLEGIHRCGGRAAKIVADMLQFSRKSEGELVLCDLHELIDQTVELAGKDYDLRKKHDFRHVEIVREFAPDLPRIMAIPTEVEQVILNLLKNASQAMQDNSDVRPPRLILRTCLEGGQVRLDVEDNGPGMPEEVYHRVFEPFFTTKDVGVGTGLGLSVSYMIITQNHHGTISVSSKEGVGTTFTVRLPVARQ